MKTHHLALLFGLTAQAITLPAHSQNIPNGSYQLSCTGISAAGDALAATCKKLNGASQATKLNMLGSCLNSISHYGDIGNIDGNLICLPDLPKPDPNFVFPQS
ncbi:MAG TPA: hypothetical protein VGP12_09030, partial [Nitrosospira sp.]|nr:hypothetical protein [Nitrosospira sp.]